MYVIYVFKRKNKVCRCSLIQVRNNLGIHIDMDRVGRSNSMLVWDLIAKEQHEYRIKGWVFRLEENIP